jgi:hypothetical protein
MKTFRLFCLTLALLSSGFAGFAGSACADDEPAVSRGQTLYLPIYSSIWHGDMKGGYPQKSLLSALISVRNTDPKRPIRLISARYFDTAGKPIAEYLGSPRMIAPMATYELYVEKQEKAGGSGASFLIAWQADVPVNPPVVEAVHADLQGHRTLAFTTTARPVTPGKAD